VIVALDWVAASSIATAAATLVLAFATFASVRSANRAARAAERSLLAGLRPVLMPSRQEDAAQRVGFVDERWLHVAGGAAAVEATDDAVYLAASLRNVGSGIAVLHGWHVYAERQAGTVEHAPLDRFRRLTRDLYIAPGELGFWQGAIRDPADPAFAAVREAIERRARFSVEVLYGDHELGRRAISRFGLSPGEDGAWVVSIVRHWNVDRPDPRL
jgi:hypothetical protein